MASETWSESVCVLERLERFLPYIAQADILYLCRVNVGLPHDLLEELEDNAIKRSVLETSLSALGERSTDGEGDDNIVWVLLRAVKSIASSASWIISIT